MFLAAIAAVATAFKVAVGRRRLLLPQASAAMLYGMETPPLAPPVLLPPLPNYPVHSQVVRVYGAAQQDGSYTGFVQQKAATNSIALRDREACYVVEPNGLTLLPGFYIGRLIGSWAGWPLFAVRCSSS